MTAGPSDPGPPPRSDTAFVVVGEPEDGRAFVDVIRAFALAGRLSDRLTIIGHGGRLRRLEKWIAALGIGHAVCLGEPVVSGPLGIREYDVLILVSRRETRLPIKIDALAAGRRVIAIDRGRLITTSLEDAVPGWLVRPGDRIALAQAMLRARTQSFDRQA